MLKDTPLAPNFSIRILAEQADDLSGSDLKELCRNAAMIPMREFMRSADGDSERFAQCQSEVRTRFVSNVLARCHANPATVLELQAAATDALGLLPGRWYKRPSHRADGLKCSPAAGCLSCVGGGLMICDTSCTSIYVTYDRLMLLDIDPFHYDTSLCHLLPGPTSQWNGRVSLAFLREL